MEGLIASVFALGLIAYFISKASGRGSITKTTVEITSASVDKVHRVNSEPRPLGFKKDLNSITSTGKTNTFSTTGEFVRSTEGFIPTDRCECGGQWVKHENKKTGGRFFGCSRYPTCDNTRDKQQAKNFCSNGHARNSQNTAYNSDGSRRCLICRPYPRENSERYLPKKRSEYVSSKPSTNRSKQVCKNGHKRTEENTYIRPNGERECRICRKQARS